MKVVNTVKLSVNCYHKVITLTLSIKKTNLYYCNLNHRGSSSYWHEEQK